MNDEIKEILDNLKDDTYVPLEDGRDYKLLYKGDDKLLLDYITNLQQENQKNKKIIKDVYNYLDEKKDVPEWWDTDFFTCMNMLSDGKLTFNDWVKNGDDENGN